MKVKMLSRKGDTMTFLLEDATPALANALRRIMVSEIPTLAIETVDFQENSSPLYDEIVAHRLGLIPMSFNPGKLSLREECKCEGKGCPLCQVVFVVDRTGPAIVRSGDMKSTSKDAHPTSPDFPITELAKGERLKLEAVAFLGKGQDHAKWQAAIATYQYYPEIVAVPGKDVQKCVRGCPKGLLEVRGTKVTLRDPAQCDLCRACLKGCDCLELKEDPNRFIFRVESVSGLKPDYIVEKAAEILESKAKEFKDLVDKL
jgi:DNA-directed RNA polymerase subunit D